MSKKFHKKAFKLWLDQLCKVCVKDRDDFTCQIQHEGCSGKMMPLDKNCQWCHVKSKQRNIMRWYFLDIICGCGHCHQWGHANPNEFGVWFAKKYPVRNDYINSLTQIPPKVWYEDDFRDVELVLLRKCLDLDVKVEYFPESYRSRFLKRIEEFKRGA